MKHNKVLITGASGFIGAHFVRRCVSDDYDVAIFLRKISNTWRLNDILDMVSVFECDVRNRGAVSSAVAAVQPDVIIHCSAYGAFEHQNDIDMMIDTNVHGVVNVIDAAVEQNVSTVINMGSSSEYGYKDYAPSEDDPVAPNSEYASTKVFGTHYCQVIAMRYKKNIVTVRPYSVYGPLEEPSRFIPSLIMYGIEGGFPPLVSKKIARDFIYIDDFINACMCIINARKDMYGNIYNVGTGVQTTLECAVEYVKQLFHIVDKPHWNTMQERKWDTTTWVGNIQKMRNDFGWEPQCPFQNGIKYFVQWIHQHPHYGEYYRQHIVGHFSSL